MARKAAAGKYYAHLLREVSLSEHDLVWQQQVRAHDERELLDEARLEAVEERDRAERGAWCCEWIDARGGLWREGELNTTAQTEERVWLPLKSQGHAHDAYTRGGVGLRQKGGKIGTTVFLPPASDAAHHAFHTRGPHIVS